STADIKQGQEKIKKQTAQQIIKLKQQELTKLINQAEQLSTQYAPNILHTAQCSSEKLLANEIERLKSLAKINPNIRQEEIQFLEQQLQSLAVIFHAIKPRLDALRVIIVT
ncbi:MAG: hypothetical protein KAI17_23850, partial [Thiotrichaceae bacterium]|nr:hypothetical protein [Thiotrichaceae bacterium]